LPFSAGSGIGHAALKRSSALALRIDMRTNTQTLPVETWENEPNLKVVARSGDKSKGLAPKMAAPRAAFRRARRELEVLGWDARVVRLVGLSRSHS
jgi:hypothetical protein